MEVFREEILEQLKSKKNLKRTFDYLFREIEKFETVYFDEIISFGAVYIEYIKAKQKSLINVEDEYKLEAFFSTKRLSLTSKILDEQEKILEENFRYIKKSLKSIPELLLNDKLEDVIDVFNELFTRIHSKHYAEYLNIISEEYNPLIDDYTTYRNRKRSNLLDMKDKIWLMCQIS